VQSISVDFASVKAAGFTSAGCSAPARVIKFSRTPAFPSDELWGMGIAAGWVTLAGEVQLPPAPPAKEGRNALGKKSLGGKIKGRKEEVETPPGWYVLPPPSSSPPRQSQEHLYLLLYCHPAA